MSMRAASGGPGRAEPAVRGWLRRESRSLRRLPGAVGLALAVLVALLFAQSFVELTARIPKTYNEGWNAFQAQRAWSGDVLYPDYGDLTGNNYPPGSYYVVGALGRALGDQVIAGRIVALLGLLVSAGAIAAALRACGASRAAQWITGLFFLAYMGARHPVYIGMDDPQWLGHAFMLSGLALVVGDTRRTFRFGAGLLLMVLGSLVKHILIPVPLAVTLWLAAHDRRALARWMGGWAILLGAAAAVFTRAYGKNWLDGLLLDPRVYSRCLLAFQFNNRFTPMVPLIATAVTAIPFLYRAQRGRLLLIYGACALAWGVFVMGGQGVDQNAVFDAEIALTLAAGIAIDRGLAARRERGGDSHAWRVALPLILPLSLAPTLLQRAYETRWAWLDRAATEETVRRDVRFMAERSGPAMCETLALCYWAGKGFEVDYFLAGQKMYAGIIDPQQLIRRIESHYYSVIQIDDTRIRTPRLPDAVLEKISENYVAGRISLKSGLLLVPRVAAASR